MAVEWNAVASIGFGEAIERVVDIGGVEAEYVGPSVRDEARGTGSFVVFGSFPL